MNTFSHSQYGSLDEEIHPDGQTLRAIPQARLFLDADSASLLT